ncbi:MAG: SpaA isopeptide-forming pilin-related protein [Enterococcus sp.]
MRKNSLLLFLIFVFSFFTELALPTMSAQATTLEKESINEQFLTLSYTCESKKEFNRWEIKIDRQTEDKRMTQRLKLKIVDEKNEPIAYPISKKMIEQDSWLIEKEYSDGLQTQLLFELPQSVKQLRLFLQVDQQNSLDTEARIQKTILKNEQPYLLTANLDDAAETSIASTEESNASVTAESKEVVGPKQLLQLDESVPRAKTTKESSIYHSLYENKETQYTTDATGTYPTAAWQPEGQTNVINHQGGFETQAGWDNQTSWDVERDTYQNSYINYGDESANPNIQLRKYVQQTSKTDEFKIKLNVRGSRRQKPGIDILLLLDNSGSMSHSVNNTGKSKKKSASDAIESLIAELKEKQVGNTIRIGAHIFSSYQKKNFYDGGQWPENKVTKQLTSDTSVWDQITSDYDSLPPEGETFTQRALMEADNMFDSAESGEREKFLFILTDGSPNLSYLPTNPAEAKKSSNIYIDNVYVKNWNATDADNNFKKGDSIRASGSKTNFIGPWQIPGTSYYLNSHLTPANSTAYDLKNKGVEIHTLALDIKPMVSGNYSDHTKAELTRGLAKMSSKKVNGSSDENSNYFFYHADNVDELATEMQVWYETITLAVEKGKITDPLGDMVELVKDLPPTVRVLENGAPAISEKHQPTISVANNQREIGVNNINLTDNQEIEVEYTVRLKTTDKSFVSGQWYPANKTTTLTPTPERTTDLLEFGIPSVRWSKADFVIPVKKIWEDTFAEIEDYWKLRPSDLTVVLQKQTNGKWQTLEKKVLNEANDWTEKFSAVEGGPDNHYRVIEPNRTAGYKAPKINQTDITSETLTKNGIEITNTLLRGDHSFWKFKEDGQTVFSDDLPKFQVKRKDGTILAKDLTPDKFGKVVINDFSIGDYLVEETYVPMGYLPITDFEISVRENDALDALVFKINDSSEDFYALNKLKDFTLRVEKVGPDGKQLSGAAFRLIGSEYDVTKKDGPIFDFAALRPGVYTLTEVKNPEGYERLQEPIQFRITVSGQVEVSPHAHVTGSGGISENGNTIELMVTNHKMRTGTLPHTGEGGVGKFFIAASVMMFLGMMLSLVYQYVNKRQPNN